MNNPQYQLFRRVARAICELDNASWHACSPSTKQERSTIERCRRDLYAIMAKHGYEFAQCDSSRIRKVKRGAK